MLRADDSDRTRQYIRCRLSIGAAILAILSLAACGSDEESSGTDQAAIEERIARERAEAEELGRQAEQIKNLERDLHEQQNDGGDSPSAPAVAPAPTSEGDWPSGVSAWTVIISSTSSRSEAQATAAGAAGGDLPTGVLYSSDYSTLVPGYWVAFVGQFSDAPGAKSVATSLSAGSPGAYPRFISE